MKTAKWKVRAAPHSAEEMRPANASIKSLETEAKKMSVVSPHYDVVGDLLSQKANITVQQLVEDNKLYRKLLLAALKKPKRTKVKNLPIVFQVGLENLGSPKVDIEIDGCLIKHVPIDSGSGVNIMTEETTHGLGYMKFESTPRVLRMADQSRRRPLGVLRDLIIVIGGV
ncbi:hypothetical protein R1flu_008456 [Riccia fluitans]|uniref:Uncharacterized protein n=1 Tax=Riccia fluitans TaxID=41844 RepID=A0ABD1YC25_9MARC